MIKIQNKYILILLCLFIFLNLNGFTQTNSKAQKQFEKVREYYQSNDIKRATEQAQKIVEKYPDFINASLLLADIYKDSKETLLEIKYLEIAKQHSTNSAIIYRLGEAHYSIGRYQKSLCHFREYLQENRVSEKRKLEVLHKIKNCEFALTAIKNPVEFNPERLSENINSENDEYWPSLSLDQQTLVFTRLLKTQGQRPQEDFFVSEFDSMGWGRASPIVDINTPLNEGAQTLSADGKLLFFTACNRSDGFGSCDIYFSRFSHGKWSIPKNAGNIINSKNWEAQPSFSADNRYLYFSSNRSGGKGQKDIWRAELVEILANGNLLFDKPENLGDSINTEGNEISPFIHPNTKSFYFASDALVGMGGLDLFNSEIQFDGTFTEPNNLGFPINTFENEQGLNISSDGETAYFSSARNAKSGLDIYAFLIGEEMRPAPVSYVKAKVVDTETGQPISAKVELIHLENNTKRMERADADGEFLVSLPLGANYAFNVSQPGYLFYSQYFQLEGVRSLDNPFEMEIKLEALKIGAQMNLYNIYFETDSFSILAESEPELQKLLAFLKNNSELKVEIQGHTDNSGNSERNQKLSELRAEAVKYYLFFHEIEKDRLKSIGFGETVPVTLNDTEQGRKLNRRTTIKILGN